MLNILLGKRQRISKEKLATQDTQDEDKQNKNTTPEQTQIR